MVAKATNTTTISRPAAPVALDRKAQHALRELRKARAAADELALKIKGYEKTIKAAMGDHEAATVGGREVATYRLAYRQNVDMTKLKDNYPDAVAACLVQKPVRTFKLLEDV